MSAHKIIRHTTFDAKNVTFSEMKKNKMGGKTVYLSNEKHKKIRLQLPKLRAPFGLSEFTDQASGRTSYSLDLSLDGSDELKTTLTQLDDLVIKTVAKNSTQWLGKKHSEAVVESALYKKIVRSPNDPKYSPTIKLKILTNSDQNFIPEAYNSKQEQVALKTIEKGQSVKAIADIVSIWIIDNKCGVTIRLEQASLAPTEKLKGYAFLDDEDNDGEDEEEDDEYDEEEGVVDE